MNRVFLNRFGHPRAVWRITIQALLILGPYLLLSRLIPLYFRNTDDPAVLLRIGFRYSVYLALLVLVGWLSLRFVDRRPFGALGVSPTRQNLKLFLEGLCIGGGILGTTFLVLLILGAVEVHGINLENLITPSFWLILLALFLAGWVEELLFRGYILFALAEGTRIWFAVLFSSILFSLAHLENSGFLWTSGLSIALLGALLAAAILRTRSLWMGAGIHLAWNGLQGPVLGVSVSGHTFPRTVLTSAPRGPEILSGGTFGIEGSLVATALVAGALWWVGTSPRFAPSDGLKALWRGYPMGIRVDEVGNPSIPQA